MSVVSKKYFLDLINSGRGVLIRMTKVLASDLSEFGIRVNYLRAPDTSRSVKNAPVTLPPCQVVLDLQC